MSSRIRKLQIKLAEKAGKDVRRRGSNRTSPVQTGDHGRSIHPKREKLRAPKPAPTAADFCETCRHHLEVAKRVGEGFNAPDLIEHWATYLCGRCKPLYKAGARV